MPGPVPETLFCKRNISVHNLSDLQKQIFDYICACRTQRMRTPSLRVIAEHFGLSKSGARFQTDCLRAKGFLYRKRYARRFVILKREISSGTPDETPVYVSTLPGEVTKRETLPDFVCCDKEKEFLFVMEDDFMHMTGIRNGDYLVVSPGPPVTGDLVVIGISGTYYLRIYSAIQRSLRRRRRYNTVVYNPFDDPGIKLIGKVILLERHFW